MSAEAVAATDQRDAYGFVEGLARLSISRSVGYELLKAGRVRTFCIGSRRYVTKAALDELVATLESETQQQSAA